VYIGINARLLQDKNPSPGGGQKIIPQRPDPAFAPARQEKTWAAASS
jgi:hypothetical protein